MEILKLKVMRGPNCWSSDHHQLIVLKIKPDGVAAYPYEVTDELIKKLVELRIPPQYLYRGQPLTDLPGVLAVALQRLCGMDCQYFLEHRVGFNNGTDVVFPYQVEDAGVYA